MSFKIKGSLGTIRLTCLQASVDLSAQRHNQNPGFSLPVCQLWFPGDAPFSDGSPGGTSYLSEVTGVQYFLVHFKWKIRMPASQIDQFQMQELHLLVFTWRRQWQPTPVLLPGESQGRGSLVGCCLWGRTESDTTEAT